MYEFKDLEAAITNKNLDLVKTIVNSNPEILSRTDEDGNTALHIAVKTKNLEILSYLCDQNININAKNNGDCTPFWVAVNQLRSADDYNLIKFLIEKKADITLGDQSLMTPLHIAAAASDTRLLAFLLENGARDSVNVQNLFGQTPLNFAIQNENSKCVELLLNEKPDFHLTTAEAKRNVLHVAVEAGNLDIVAQIVKKNPKLIGEKDRAGDTPLSLSLDKEYKKIPKLLLEHLKMDPSQIVIQSDAIHNRVGQKGIKILDDILKDLTAPQSQHQNNDSIRERTLNIILAIISAISSGLSKARTKFTGIVTNSRKKNKKKHSL